MEWSNEPNGAVRGRLSRRAFLRNSAVVMGGAVAASALAACGGGAAPAAPAAPAATAAEAGTVPAAASGTPMTLRVWGFGLDDARAQARVGTFTEQFSNITLEPVGGELNTQQLLTAVASGNPPEVVNVDRAETGSWAARGAIQSLDDLIARDSVDMGQFYPVTVQQVTYNGQVYGMPQFVNIDLFWVNLNALEEAGMTMDDVDPSNWEALTAMGERLTIIENNQLVRYGFDTKMQDGRLWLWSWANGTSPMSEDGMTANFNDPKVIEALTWAKETVDAQGGEEARAAFQQTQNFFSPQNPFLIGQTPTTIFEHWLLGVIKVDPEARFVVMSPKMRNSDENISDATGSALAIPRGVSGDAREMAWAFLKGLTTSEAWLAGEQATKANNEADGVPYHPPITGNTAADQEIWSTMYDGIGESFDQAIAAWPDALAAARARYSGPVAAAINDFMRSNVNDALLGAKTPEQAMEDLQQQAQQELDNFEPSV